MRPTITRGYSTNAALSAKISETLSRHADSCLLSDENLSLTGREVREHLQSIESFLIGISQPASRVGIVMENSVTKALCILATIKAGRVPVIYNANESFSLLSKSKNLSCLMTDTYIEQCFKLPYPVVQMDHEAKIIFEYTTRPRPVDLTPKGSCLILFTSGSSGDPKGVFVPEEGIIYTIDYLINYFGLGSQTKATIFLPTSHSMGLNTQFFPTFFAGGESIFVNTSKNLSRLYRSLFATQGTFLGMIGDMLRICYEEKRRRKLPAADFVKHIQLAGGIIHSEHLRMARELFPNAIIHKGYGMTEATRIAMINSTDPNFHKDTAGYVWPAQQIEVRNKEGQKLGPGGVGQIHIRGPNVALGYDRAGDRPLERGEFFPTGDIGVFDQDGRISILGRSDSIFKINGERISAREIEQVAIESNFCIRDVKCLPIDSSENKRSKAVLFLEIPEDVEEDFLSLGKDTFETNYRLSMREKRYLPRDIFVLRQFPRTPNGKLRARQLKELYLERSAEAESLGPSKKGLSIRRFSQSSLVAT